MLLSGKYKINGIITKGTYSSLYEGEHIIKKHKVATLDINGKVSQTIQLDNGIIWCVSHQAGTSNYLLQVVRKIDGKEIGRLLFYVVD